MAPTNEEKAATLATLAKYEEAYQVFAMGPERETVPQMIDRTVAYAEGIIADERAPPLFKARAQTALGSVRGFFQHVDGNAYFDVGRHHLELAEKEIVKAREALINHPINISLLEMVEEELKFTWQGLRDDEEMGRGKDKAKEGGEAREKDKVEEGEEAKKDSTTGS